MKSTAIPLIVSLLALSAYSQGTTFTNRTATFTNMQGRVYRNVTLVRTDLDGLVWHSGASGGRICYTNLSPEFLAGLGVPTNAIDVARRRAERKTVSDAQYRAAALRAGQAQLQAKDQVERAKKEAWEAGAPARERDAKMKKDLEQINLLARQVAVLQQQRDAAWDYYVYTDDSYYSVTVGSRSSSADTAATRLATARGLDAKLAAARERLATMRAAFDAKYQ